MFGHLFQLIHQGPGVAVSVGFLLIVLVSFLPVIPIPVISAVLGSILPLWIAVSVAWSATVTGAILKFYLERTVLRIYVNRLLSRFPQWNAILRLVDKHGFFAIVLVRCIPFFPSAIVNFAAAVTRFPFPGFVLATAIGLFPAILAFTLAGNQIHHHAGASIAIVVSYGVVICALGWKFRSIWRAQRQPSV